MNNRTEVFKPASNGEVVELIKRVEKLEQELVLLRRAVWSNSGITYGGWPPPNNTHQSPYFLTQDNKTNIVQCATNKEK